MSAPRGRTYCVQIDVIAEEYVTILDNGDFVLEDAVTGNYVAVGSDELESFAQSDPPYTAHIVECIRRDLLDDTHDQCGWEWTRQSETNSWYRPGQCPSCSRATECKPSAGLRGANEQLPLFAVHHVWVELLDGERYGTPTRNVYNKALAGTSAQAPVGVWDQYGNAQYRLGFAPAAEVLDAMRHELEHLGIETWADQRDAKHGTWGDGWTVIRSALSADELLQTLHSAFVDNNPPIRTEQDAHEQVRGATPSATEIDQPLEGEQVPEYHPAARFVIAQSWWIASELVRRHPDLVIHESHPGGGMYDCLTLLTAEALTPIAQVNRAGTIRASENSELSVRWDQVMSASSPHAIVKQIEAATGLRPPARTPASTHKVLAYRFVAAALHAAVNDRHAWDARNEFIDTADWWPGDAELHGYLAAFPHAIKDLRSTPHIGLWHEPESHFWALLRAEKPVALVSIEGKVYVRDRTIDLRSEYSTGKSMQLIVATVLAELR